MKLEERDKQYIWHPLNQHKTHPTSKGIVKGEGIYLYDEVGNKYIDGISSWYTAVYGHCNPYILQEVKDQLGKLNQIVFSGFTHEPAVVLSEKLMEILPQNQAKVFFSDNGSTAVEVGIKMALQHWSNKGIKKNKLIAFNEGFHGDTFGAMSVSGQSIYNKPFKNYLVKVERILPPTNQNINYVLEYIIKLVKSGEVVALVYEPLVQGAAGMKMHDAEALNNVLQLCKEHEVLLVADEVMTGFGKTGTNFASDHMEIKPDIICLSKALSGGVLPLAITSCTQEIYNAFLNDDPAKGLFHAHTYSANPIACRAAIASVELLQSQEIQDGIKRLNVLNRSFLEEIRSSNKIENTRQIGVIAAFDFKLENNSDTYGKFRDNLYDFFMKKGLCLRPLGNTIYWVLPYVSSEEQIKKVHNIIRQSIDFV